MSRKPRHDARSAAPRARSTNRSSNGPTRNPPPATGGEYVMLSVWQIQPAPWQPRRVFDHVEELAATIEGNSETEGVGVLEPVLVRPLDDGGFQLIDGERRLRAGRLIAERSSTRDFLLPARVFRVSERIARLMGQTANLERSEPRPYEVALGYQSIREALREEFGTRATSTRSLAGIGWHEKTQISDYLRIADALTPDVLAAAGLLGATGEPDFARLCRMQKNELHNAAKLKSPEACAAALKTRVDRLTGVAPARAKPTAPAPAATPDERRAQITTGVGFAVKVRTPAQMMAPSDARALVQSELVPAMLAMVERAHGGGGGEGYLAAVAAGHVLLVVPGEVEALSMPQLERLTQELKTLRQRTDRALRLRRQIAAAWPSAT